MAEPFDTLAAELAEIIKDVSAGTLSEADAALALIPLLSGLAPVQWEQLAKVIQVLGRVEGQLFTDGPPADTLGAIGSTAIDMTAKIFYGPKTEDGWGAGEQFVGDTGPSGTITSVTTETTAVGTEAEVIAGGTPQARTLHFKIPDTVDTAVALFDMMGRADMYAITLIGIAARFAASGVEVLFSSGYYRTGLLESADPEDLVGWTYSRTGAATAEMEDGTVVRFAANVPRIVDGKGVLIEPARTNLILRSEEIDHAAWAKYGDGTGSVPTVTANAAIAPDGTMTADRVTLTLNGGNTFSDFSALISTAFSTTIGVPYAGSGYVKGSLGDTIAVRHVGGSAYLLHTFSGEWERIERIETAGDTLSELFFGLRGGVGVTLAVTFDTWGWDVGEGDSVKSYIPTTSAAATRAADDLAIDWPDYDAYTVFAEVEWPANGAANGIFLEGFGVRGVTFGMNGAGTAPRLLNRHGSTRIDAEDAVLPGAGDIVRMAVSSGGLAAVDGIGLTGSTPAQGDWLTQVQIGARNNGVLDLIAGAYIREIVFIPGSLTDLTDLTD